MNKTAIRLASVLSFGLLALILTLYASGCCRKDDATHGNSKNSEFAMNVLVSAVPFFDDTRATWAAAGEYNGVKTIYGGPLDTDAQKQIEEIDTLINKGVNGLVVAPTDSAALAPVINRAVEKGIPVVTYLNDVPNSKRLAYVTSEREEASLKIGRSVFVPGAASYKAIIIYAQAGNLEQEGRRRGFEMLKKEYPQLEVVAIISDKFDAAQATEQMRPLLTKFREVTHIFGCGSRSAVGAVAALKELNYNPGQVTVTGWDYDEDTLNLIGDGWVQVTAAQNTSYMTQVAFNILQAKVGGYLYPKNHPFEENGLRALPETIVIPVELVTKGNRAGYYTKK